MSFFPFRAAAPLLALTLVLGVTGCGTSSDDEAAAGPGMTDLAPSYDARPDGAAIKAEPGSRVRKEAGSHPTRSRATKAGPRAVSGTAQAEERSTRQHDGPSRPGPVAAAPGPVRVSDPTGDLSTSAEGTPASADILAVRLSRSGDTVEVRTTFAAAPPTRQNGSRGMNVASFYDVDDNGIVDYEVWASLADNGWGTGHLDRRQDKASFGPSTGIRVSVEGDTLVTRFPADRIGNAAEFRWSAASEWGSYESMAASTSARDYAPDEGAVDYPG